MEQVLKKYRKHKFFLPVVISVIAILILLSGFSLYRFSQEYSKVIILGTEKDQLNKNNTQLSASLSATQKAFDTLRNQDQVKINKQLKADIDKIHGDYSGSIDVYQKIIDLRTAK